MRNNSTLPAEVTLNHKKSLGKRIIARWQLYLLLIVPVGFVLVFNYGPMAGLVIAFENYTVRGGIFGSDWVGFDNFIEGESNKLPRTVAEEVALKPAKTAFVPSTRFKNSTKAPQEVLAYSASKSSTTAISTERPSKICKRFSKGYTHF